MKKGFKTFLLMVLTGVGFLLCTQFVIARVDHSASKQITLFGFISSAQGTEELAGLPVYYMGGEYSVAVDKESEIRKATFELYEKDKPSQLYILVTSPEHVKLPDANHFEHLELIPGKEYKLYKLTKFTVDMQAIDPIDLLHNKKSIEWHDSWRIQEVQFKDNARMVPDNTIIMFMNPDFVERLDVREWSNSGTSIYLPTIVIKDSITKEMMRSMRDRMVVGSINFRSFHKKPFKAIVQCASNRLISIPFNPRGYA